jgi:hypothetical protein
VRLLHPIRASVLEFRHLFPRAVVVAPKAITKAHTPISQKKCNQNSYFENKKRSLTISEVSWPEAAMEMDANSLAIVVRNVDWKQI